MNSKWYLSTLIIVLALLGLSQEQTKVANQQIVLQFTDVEMTSVTARDHALAAVTQKLQAYGIANIEIVEDHGTKLSLRYYSDTDALSVAEFLAQDSELSLAYKGVDQLPVDFPKDKLPDSCSITVSDLQQSEGGQGLNGKFAFELQQDYKRFSNPVYILFNDLIVLEQDAIVQVAYIRNRINASTIDNTSNAIPEVRAGPRVHGNS